MGGRELCAEDKRELVVAAPPDALVIDIGGNEKTPSVSFF